MDQTGEQCPTECAPTFEDILEIWRTDRCVQESSAGVYLQWVKRFRAYCRQHTLDECTELTLAGARRFVTQYAQLRGLDAQGLGGARSALNALNHVYKVTGLNPPAWQLPLPKVAPKTIVLQEFVKHLAQHRGNPEPTIHKKLTHIKMLLEHLEESGKTWDIMALTDIDAFLIGCSERYATITVANIAGSVRAFSRFLLASGRISVDLAESVISPRLTKLDRPRRALSWTDVQRLLRSVDLSVRGGLRDRALLLLMSTYGLGAGEIIRLKLEHIDWTANTLRVVRPKTGVGFTLPLLPAVAKALALYLRDERPPNTPHRHLFVSMKMPFGPLRGAAAIRHIIVKHAKTAELNVDYLGSHVLRHSNAARHVDLGTRPQVLSNLLGHRDPDSVSAYVRIAAETLRDVSLPVPA